MSRINKAAIDNRISVDAIMKLVIPAINDNNDRIETLERFSHAAPVPAKPSIAEGFVPSEEISKEEEPKEEAPAAKATSKKAARKKK